jgi:hypothetical protein
MTHPLLYEINTRCWLRELSDRLGRSITLANVPDEEIARWRSFGFTHLWLMGVWTTGPRARELALKEPNLRRAYDEALPDWREEDVAGSPYSIAKYEVPLALGGEAGLQEFRARLHRAELRLILDFVPNHVGIDHPWLIEQPDLFVQSPTEVEGTFAPRAPAPTGVPWIAHGKDPYFPCWTDVAQLDYRRPAARAAMKAQLLSVAARCDGVRCDMAMLLLNDVFARTWREFPISGTPPKSEFWSEAIPAVKAAHPDFLFLAEVYWELEERLQSLGFDYTYDKQLYDDLIRRNPIGAQRRLLELPRRFVAASAHFLENHDEPRVAALLPLPEHREAALLILGLPGMRFLHEGQLTGARIKLPVQLGRRPAEALQPDVQQMYATMLPVLLAAPVGRGQGAMLSPRAAWPGNPTGQNFIAVQWQSRPPEFDVVVVNLAPHRSQCYAPLRLAGLAEFNWSMRDLLGPETYVRAGSDLAEQGLYLDLPGHGAQLFHFTPAS